MKSFLTRSIVSLALAGSACGLVSCATGPAYSEVKSTLPPIAKGHGRVFVYRPSTFGAAIKPDVKIDDKVIGTSEGRGFLYSDQTAGTHQISIGTEWTHRNSVTVKPGQPSFVRCKVTPGVIAAHVIPDQVDQATGESDIQSCKLSQP